MSNAPHRFRTGPQQEASRKWLSNCIEARMHELISGSGIRTQMGGDALSNADELACLAAIYRDLHDDNVTHLRLTPDFD